MTLALLHIGADVKCMHAGSAQPNYISFRVKVNGHAVVLQTSHYTIAGCGLSTSPCVTATWKTAASRIKSEGVPLLLQNSQARCVPTGTGLNILSTQTHVKGQ